jgi:uncharacterized repeat protein (TIGR03803 family)
VSYIAFAPTAVPAQTEGFPGAGLIFDSVGNVYGTTLYGGTSVGGTVFKLTRNSDGNWTESVLHSFFGTDGFALECRLIFDGAGNLYGTTDMGGAYGYGTVFKLTPNSDGSWTESVLYSFKGAPDGQEPTAGLVFDAAGNLYGTTEFGGSKNCPSAPYPCGTVFELTPNSDGSWTEHVLHRFTGNDGNYPVAGVTFDAAGNLYGTASSGGADNFGVVFKLTPTSGGGWSYRVLHTFANKPGFEPYGGLSFDATGNLYGTTTGDGSTTYGSVFEITP